MRALRDRPVQELHPKSLASALRSFAPRATRTEPTATTTETTMIYRCLYIDVADPAFLRLDGKYRATFLDSEAVWRYARDPENDLNEESARRALAARDECFAIRDGDTLAAYGWYSRAGAFHVSDTLRLHFDPQWAYMYRGFTHPAYRGQRLPAI